MDQHAIIERLFARDESALEALADTYGGYCATVARNILGDEHDTEECLNDTYLAVWQAIPPARPDNLATYLGRLTRNLALTRRRNATAAKRGGGEHALVLDELGDVVADATDVADEVERRAVLAAIEEWLEGQSPRNRRIFVRRYWYFAPVKAIAAECGLREGAVSVTLNRMRKQLRQHLEKEGFAP